MTTRRHFVAANLIGAAGLASKPEWAFPAAAPGSRSSDQAITSNNSEARSFWNDWPKFIAGKMNQAREERLAKIAAIHTAAEMQERAASFRAKIWELIGGVPERTPLNARVTGKVERDGYKIENIVFESMPQVYVTANLYLPTLETGPFPAIIAPVGHSDNGKAYHSYQHLYQNLARQGYVVLAYDPFGQGERLQYMNPATGQSRFEPTGEHDQAGRPMTLVGDNFALYCSWDAIRGLDYLVGRPEVDPNRLGCTGQSGGGTITMYLAALEPRLHAAVVLEGNSENVAGPSYDPPGAVDDSEQNIVGALPLSFDRADLLAAFAPKPLLICYTTHDEGVTYSPVYEEATIEMYRELQVTYELLGSKDKVGLFASHLPHGLNFIHRSRTYAWFNQWLKDGKGNTSDAALDVFPEKLLYATSTGQVTTSLGGRSVVQLNSDRVRSMLPKSSFLGASTSAESVQKSLGETLSKLLALPSNRLPLESKILSSNPRKDTSIDEFQFESEPGIRVPGWFVKPLTGKAKYPVILYLADDCGDGIVAEPGSMDQLLSAGYAVCAISPRGLGRTTPRPPKGGPLYYHGSVPVEERFAWAGMALGLPVIGQRVWDVLRSIDYVLGRPDVDLSQVRILGRGQSGLAAQMAALIDERPKSVLLEHTLVSYTSLVEAYEYSLNLSWFVPGILKHFDLPDISAAIYPRPCWILNGAGPDGKVLSESSVRGQYKRRLADNASALGHLRFITESTNDLQATYLAWANNT